ncbi:protein BCAP isoform X1 [Coregonus clupeaformis]|uniref:protein BCAP isoform X1 n=1 Tax=Coregonus clupeaformis TaxID=59861 RepID=UPI001E1C5F5E|nr:protein BCAP isoform X1 [Coregonus clupeaformis]
MFSWLRFVQRGTHGGRQQEQKTDERIQLDAQIGLLKGQIADITLKLQKERDEFTAANEVLLLKVEKLNTENRNIGLENATLKASIAGLELQLVHSEAALKEESTLSQERKDQAEQDQGQVAELQMEVDDLRIKLESVLRETENIREGRGAEVEKVRLELEGCVRELEEYPELLSATEQSLTECQDNLKPSEKRCADKAEAIRQLQVKVESQGEKMRSSLDMKESIHEANSQLQQKVDALQKQMEELHGVEPGAGK